MANLEESYLSARTPQARRKAALTGLASLLLWLGWLRFLETFDLCWHDFDVVEPVNGPSQDLPQGLGVVGVWLGPKTKSSHNKPVDMSLAYQTTLENGSTALGAIPVLAQITGRNLRECLLMKMERLGRPISIAIASSTHC